MPPRGSKGAKSAKSVKARVKPRVPKVLTPISDEEDSVHSSRESTPLPSEVGDSDVGDIQTSPIIPHSQDIAPAMYSSQEAFQRSKKSEALFLTDVQQEDVIDWMRE